MLPSLQDNPKVRAHKDLDARWKKNNNEKGTRGHPLSEKPKASNRKKSKTRWRVAHIFTQMNGSMKCNAACLQLTKLVYKTLTALLMIARLCRHHRLDAASQEVLKHCLDSNSPNEAPMLAAEVPRKAPFRVLYSNDLTNISSCVSRFHAVREAFRPEMLDATVDEIAGLVDAHFLQPGLSVVPLWPGKVFDLKEHFSWIKQRYGQRTDSFSQFVLNGGDIVQCFIERCRERKQAASISKRSAPPVSTWRAPPRNTSPRSSTILLPFAS